jgi:hypothetical protein
VSGRREVLITDGKWEKVRRFIPKVEYPRLVDRELKIAAALRASYGFLKVALTGNNYQKDFLPQHVPGEISRVG